MIKPKLDRATAQHFTITLIFVGFRAFCDIAGAIMLHATSLCLGVERVTYNIHSTSCAVPQAVCHLRF